MEKPVLQLLDHGWFELDKRLHYAKAGLATGANKNPSVTWQLTPCFSAVLRHPDYNLVIDTGTGGWTKDSDALVVKKGEDNTFEKRFSEIGLKPENADALFMTHLHLGHTGNLHRFADTDVPVYAHKDELEMAAYVDLVYNDIKASQSPYAPEDYNQGSYNWHPLEGEQGELYDDVEWIKLPGHSPGSVGLLITLFEEPVFLIMDAVLRHDNIFPEGDVSEAGQFPDVVHPTTNWSHGAWRNQAVERIFEIEESHEPNRIHGHDPIHYNTYDSYSGVELISPTEFDPE